MKSKRSTRVSTPNYGLLPCKRSQGELITTVLIILVVLAAVAIVATFVVRTVRTSTEAAENKTASQIWDFSVSIPDVTLASAVIEGPDALVTVSRSGGQASEAIRIIIIITDANGAVQNYTTPEDQKIALLETKTYRVPLTIPNPQKVEIYPVVNKNNGEVIGSSAGSSDASWNFEKDALIGYYNFDGNVNDFAANPANGVCNTTTVTRPCNYVSGVKGQGIYLTGTNLTSIFLDLGTVNKYAIQNKTINFWANHTGVSYNQIVFSASSGNYYIGTGVNSLSQSYSNSSQKQKYKNTGTVGTLADGKFDMFSYTYDVKGNDVNVSYYYNGNYVASYFVSEGYGTINPVFRIGCYSVKCTNTFNGTIDELSIYNRPLSSVEIKKLYSLT